MSKGNLFGVDVLGVADEFLPQSIDARVFDLGTFGLPWIPAFEWTSARQRGSPAQWHVHKGCIEVIYCRSGRCEYMSCGETYAFTPGQVFVSREDEPHRQSAVPKGYSTFSFIFRPQTKSNADVNWFRDRLLKLPRLFRARRSVHARFVRIFGLLERGAGDDTQGFRLRLRTEVQSLLFEILDSELHPVRKRQAAPSFQELVARMQRHPERDYPLCDLARVEGKSVATFIEAFKAETGFSPHAYLQNCRIETAKRELARGRSVKSVADALCFASPQHFATQFKKITGSSPLAWRRS